ncbi:hypothetical protein [Aquimarina sediminis]|uniref:hypothetical protein n=1 Tax=Aquimarina sediminis TaxID=2070536 RepID=UPI0013E8F37F|nr:hypothetical protein [Aquimarina sediminis]
MGQILLALYKTAFIIVSKDDICTFNHTQLTESIPNSFSYVSLNNYNARDP